MYCGDFKKKHEGELDFNLSLNEMDKLVGSALTKMESNISLKDRGVSEKDKDIVNKMNYWDFYAIYQDVYTRGLWDK